MSSSRGKGLIKTCNHETRRTPRASSGQTVRGQASVTFIVIYLIANGLSPGGSDYFHVHKHEIKIT